MACKNAHLLVAGRVSIHAGTPPDAPGQPEVQKCDNCGWFVTNQGLCVNAKCDFGKTLDPVTADDDEYAVMVLNETSQLLNNQTLSQYNSSWLLVSSGALSPKLQGMVNERRAGDIMRQIETGTMSLKQIKTAGGKVRELSPKASLELSAALSLLAFDNSSKITPKQAWDEIVSWEGEYQADVLSSLLRVKDQFPSADWAALTSAMTKAMDIAPEHEATRLLNNLAGVKDIPDDTMRQILPYLAYSSLSEGPISAFLKHPVCREKESQAFLAKSPNVWLRREMAMRVITSPDTLRQLAKDSDAKTREYAITSLIQQKTDNAVNAAVQKLRSKGVAANEMAKVISEQNNVWRSTPRCPSCGRWLKQVAPVCKNPNCGLSGKEWYDDSRMRHWGASKSPVFHPIIFTRLSTDAKGEYSPQEIESIYQELQKDRPLSSDWNNFIDRQVADFAEAGYAMPFPNGMSVAYIGHREGFFLVDKNGRHVSPIPATTPKEAVKAALGMYAAKGELKVCDVTGGVYAGTIPTQKIPKRMRVRRKGAYKLKLPDWKLPDSRTWLNGYSFVDKRGDVGIKIHEKSGEYQFVGKQHSWQLGSTELKQRVSELARFAVQPVADENVPYGMKMQVVRAYAPDDPGVANLPPAPSGIQMDTSNGVWFATKEGMFIAVAADTRIPYHNAIVPRVMEVVPDNCDMIMAGNHVSWRDPGSGSVIEAGSEHIEVHNFNGHSSPPKFNAIFEGADASHYQNAELIPRKPITIPKNAATPYVRLYADGGVLYAEGVSPRKNDTKLIARQAVGTVDETAVFPDALINAHHFNDFVAYAKKTPITMSVSPVKNDALFFAAQNGSFTGAVMQIDIGN